MLFLSEKSDENTQCSSICVSKYLTFYLDFTSDFINPSFYERLAYLVNIASPLPHLKKRLVLSTFLLKTGVLYIFYCILIYKYAFCAIMYYICIITLNTKKINRKQ